MSVDPPRHERVEHTAHGGLTVSLWALAVLLAELFLVWWFFGQMYST
jgi:hypothetical protein